MKKTLALVLAFALVFSTMTMAFADDAAAISANAKICADLKILKGETGTVEAGYLKTTPTRIQALVMFLRLKGLEEDAKAFKGEANFADAKDAEWAKPIMAYAKAHPELGWIGDGTNFSPTKEVTAKEYYKVMLEALGYKQNTATVVGDFTWDNVMDFAAKQGLAKSAAAATFTVDDLATATVEALRATVKDAKKTLVATLVEAGKLDKDAATTVQGVAGTTDAKIDTVKAIGNSTILVTFNGAVEKTFAENVANFKIEGLEVKSAVLDGTKQVVIETAAMTAGTSYTVTIGSETPKFTAIAKDAAAPEIDEVEGSDTNTITVTFTKKMDVATALDKANYKVDGATIEKVEWNDSDARDEVKVTATGMTIGKSYKLVVNNIKSTDGVVVKAASTETFTAKSDKKAPVIDEDNTKAQTNTRIVVAFTDDNELTKESAENLANWKVTVGSGSDALEIKSAKLVENDDDDLLNVELTTATQKSGQKYVVHASNIVDTAVLANKMKSEDTADIHGKKADTDEPKFDDISYIGNDTIKVSFRDDSRMDFASMTDVANYSISKDVKINSVVLKDKDDDDCKAVLLKVSGLDDDTSYKVTVNNVADEFSNKMKASNKSKKYNESDASRKTLVTHVVTKSDTEIILTFSSELDEKTAEDEANYSINKSIGAPKKAELSDNNKEVTLTTATMNANTSYTVTINGVEDEGGRALTNVVAKAYVSPDDIDTEEPGFESADAIDYKTIRVTYDEPISYTSGQGQYAYIDTDGKPGTIELIGKQTIAADDDQYEMEFTLYTTKDGKTPDAVITPAQAKNVDATIVKVYGEDNAGNVCEDTNEDIELITDKPEDVEVTTWEQYSPKEFRVEFEQKVKLVQPTKADGSDDTSVYELKSNVYGTDYVVINANPSQYRPYTMTAQMDPDSDFNLKITTSTPMADDKEIRLQFNKFVTTYHDVFVTDSDNNGAYTALETDIDDTDEPYIEEVNVVDANEIDITFNEDLSNAGDYYLLYTDKDGKEKTINPSEVRLNRNGNWDQKLVQLFFKGNHLEGRYSYDLIPTSKAKDIKGNAADWTLKDKNEELASFDGTDTLKPDTYIAGVRFYNADRIRPYFNDYVYYSDFASHPYVNSDDSDYFKESVVTIEYSNEATSNVWKEVYNTGKVTFNPYGVTDYEFDDLFSLVNITMNMTKTDIDNNPILNADGDAANVPLYAFNKDTNYKVTVNTKSPMTYTFEGIGEYDSIKVNKAATDKYTVTYDDMQTGDLVAFINADRKVVAWALANEDNGATLNHAGLTGTTVAVMIVRDPNAARNTNVAGYLENVELK